MFLHCGEIMLGNWVVGTLVVEGIAPRQPLHGQPAALDRAVLLNRLQRVLRAGGGEPAPGRKKGRDTPLIKSDQLKKDALRHANPLPAGAPAFWPGRETTAPTCGNL